MGPSTTTRDRAVGHTMAATVRRLVLAGLIAIAAALGALAAAPAPAQAATGPAAPPPGIPVFTRCSGSCADPANITDLRLTNGNLRLTGFGVVQYDGTATIRTAADPVTGRVASTTTGRTTMVMNMFSLEPLNITFEPISYWDNAFGIAGLHIRHVAIHLAFDWNTGKFSLGLGAEAILPPTMSAGIDVPPGNPVTLVVDLDATNPVLVFEAGVAANCLPGATPAPPTSPPNEFKINCAIIRYAPTGGGFGPFTYPAGVSLGFRVAFGGNWITLTGTDLRIVNGAIDSFNVDGDASGPLTVGSSRITDAGGAAGPHFRATYLNPNTYPNGKCNPIAPATGVKFPTEAIRGDLLAAVDPTFNPAVDPDPTFDPNADIKTIKGWDSTLNPTLSRKYPYVRPPVNDFTPPTDLTLNANVDPSIDPWLDPKLQLGNETIIQPVVKGRVTPQNKMGWIPRPAPQKGAKPLRIANDIGIKPIDPIVNGDTKFPVLRDPIAFSIDPQAISYVPPKPTTDIPPIITPKPIPDFKLSDITWRDVPIAPPVNVSDCTKPGLNFDISGGLATQGVKLTFAGTIDDTGFAFRATSKLELNPVSLDARVAGRFWFGTGLAGQTAALPDGTRVAVHDGDWTVDATAAGNANALAGLAPGSTFAVNLTFKAGHIAGARDWVRGDGTLNASGAGTSLTASLGGEFVRTGAGLDYTIRGTVNSGSTFRSHLVNGQFTIRPTGATIDVDAAVADVSGGRLSFHGYASRDVGGTFRYHLTANGFLNRSIHGVRPYVSVVLDDTTGMSIDAAIATDWVSASIHAVADASGNFCGNGFANVYIAGVPILSGTTNYCNYGPNAGLLHVEFPYALFTLSGDFGPTSYNFGGTFGIDNACARTGTIDLGITSLYFYGCITGALDARYDSTSGFTVGARLGFSAGANVGGTNYGVSVGVNPSVRINSREICTPLGITVFGYFIGRDLCIPI